MEAGFIQQTVYEAFSDGQKATKRVPPNKLTRWTITQFKDSTIKGIKKAWKLTQI